MSTVQHHTCTLCEATCGIDVTVEAGRVTGIRGDTADPFSRGYICPKATALADLHHDPDRLRTPLIRDGEHWRQAGWEEALELVARRLKEVRARHGRDAVGVYYGNPTAHNLGAVVYGPPLFRALRTRNVYAASSIDQLPHMVAAHESLGNPALVPVPDVDRSDLFVCVGGNPAVSNGSIMTAPNMRGRLKAIRDRGGRVVVVDPRRTETAALSDEHVFIRPGTDALMLLSIVSVLFTEGLVKTGRLAPKIIGTRRLREAVAGFSPESTEAATGVDAETVRELARELAATPRAVVYGRVGICTQEFGGLAAWLVVVVNTLTAHLDEPGGLMFPTPALDVIPLTNLIRRTLGFGPPTRVRGLPTFFGERPVAALAEEMDTPGDGQIRAFITSAGNPALSTPNAPRLERALPNLEFMISIDPYLNETTRFADVILPPTSALERSHYEAVLMHFAVRNAAKYSPPVFERGPDQRHDWEILLGLGTKLLASNALGRLAGRALRLVAGGGPEPMVAAGLLAGPYGLRRLRDRVSLRKLRQTPHGVDLGPLRRRLPGRLPGLRKRINLAPRPHLGDLPRLRRRMEQWSQPGGDVVLIGRRQLRSNNSWLHNTSRLVRGSNRCTLLVHPDDAAAHGLTDGGTVEIASASGTIEAPVEVTDSIMPGVVSLPHGWGHGRGGTRLAVANDNAGVSLNDVTDEHFVDELTGTSAVSGVRVHLGTTDRAPSTR